MHIEKLENVLNLLEIEYTIHYDESDIIIMNSGGDFCLFIKESSERIWMSFNVNAHPIYAAVLVNTLNKEGISIEIDDSFYISDEGVVFGYNAEKEAQEDHEKEIENEVKMARILDDVDTEDCHHC